MIYANCKCGDKIISPLLGEGKVECLNCGQVWYKYYTNNGQYHFTKYPENDHILFTEQHYKKAMLIQPHIKSRLIFIGGEAGTGKTEVAMLLSEYLDDAVCIHLDQYYKTKPQERDEWRISNGVQNVGRNEIRWNDITLPHARYVVVEGLYALWWGVMHPSAHEGLRVFLKGTGKETYNFRKKRLKENPDTLFRKMVLNKEHEEVIETLDMADLVIPWEV